MQTASSGPNVSTVPAITCFPAGIKGSAKRMFAITVIIKITWTMIIQTIAAAGNQLMFSCVDTVCGYSV